MRYHPLVIAVLLFEDDKIMRQGVRKHFFNENYFESIDSEDKAYWLGFIAADGSVIKSSEYNSYRLQIALSNVDIKHLNTFLEHIGANDIKIQIIEPSGFAEGLKDKNTVRIVLNSYKLCSDLYKFNIHQNKTYDVKMPNISDNMIPHYLRGLFDGDGSYYCHYDLKYNRYRYSFEFVSASKIMVYQIQEYLLSKNIKTNIYVRKSPSSDNNVYRLMTGSKKEMLKIIDLLYSDAHIYLDRKYNKINEIKNIAV